jgi:glycine cleavage system aminomethyltransferase T
VSRAPDADTRQRWADHMISSIQATSRDTVRVSSRRFERSPFEPCWAQPDMVLGVYAGRTFPLYLGQDATEKYWILRRKCALYDVPERPVEINGPDAAAFLDHVLARHVATLPEGRGRYAIACTPDGGIFMDGVLFRLSENRFWYVQPDGALETWLMAHVAGFDVTISDPASRALQIQGPASRAVMGAATGGTIGDGLKYFHSGFFEIGGQEVYVSRTGWTGELGYEVYTQGPKTDCEKLWSDLMAAGQPLGMEFSASPSMEIRRIEAGILDNITDFDWSMTPFQAGLGKFIDMDKAEFVGRKALLEADRECLLFGLKCAVAVPRMNDLVLAQGQRAGRVTAGAWSPYLKCAVGYVRFDGPGDWEGRELVLEKADGACWPCEVVSLPFYDPEKLIPRGLDMTLP